MRKTESQAEEKKERKVDEQWRDCKIDRLTDKRGIQKGKRAKSEQKVDKRIIDDEAAEEEKGD